MSRKKKASTIAREILENTKYCPGFVPAEYSVVFVKESPSGFNSLFLCDDVAESLERDKGYKGNLRKAALSEPGIYLMNKETEEVFALDKSCRAQLFGMAKMSGSELYKDTVYANVSLNYALSMITKNVKIVIRDNKIISILSDNAKIKNPLPTLLEIEKHKLEMENTVFDGYKLVADFVIKKVNGYKYILRFLWSDTGEVAYRLEGCIKPENAENVVILFKAKTVDKVLSLIENYYDIDFNVIIPDKTSQNILKCLGQKRLKKLKEKNQYSTVGKILQVPSIVGNINYTTDNEIATKIGDFVTKTFKINLS